MTRTRARLNFETALGEPGCGRGRIRRAEVRDGGRYEGTGLGGWCVPAYSLVTKGVDGREFRQRLNWDIELLNYCWMRVQFCAWYLTTPGLKQPEH
ncbi:hypothetical protein I7I48_11819 [Histoplasma ohiense]|nr:hypothetical protein I7I48_11819 [Histoplasma ohiense (nom. inval.)]